MKKFAACITLNNRMRRRLGRHLLEEGREGGGVGVWLGGRGGVVRPQVVGDGVAFRHEGLCQLAAEEPHGRPCLSHRQDLRWTGGSLLRFHAGR